MLALSGVKSDGRTQTLKRLLWKRSSVIKPMQVKKKLGNKFGRPQRCMGIVLQKRLLETRFKYQSPLADTPLQTLGAQLPREAFETAHERQTLPFHEIVSTSPKPPWPSPGAANANIMHIDMYTCEWHSILPAR